MLKTIGYVIMLVLSSAIVYPTIFIVNVILGVKYQFKRLVKR